MNTYRLDATNPFKPDLVKEVIKTVLEKELENVKYDAKDCAKQCMDISHDICNKVKLLGFDRHKLICTVEIGEKNKQSLFSAVRFLWDAERDNLAFYTYENIHIFAVACVYGIYYE
ncbi:Tctex1 domain-containing protein 1 [Blattella germanica]|nr:Tctex1 domain-containing protein 1 [Blattella germanica]